MNLHLYCLWVIYIFTGCTTSVWAINRLCSFLQTLEHQTVEVSKYDRPKPCQAHSGWAPRASRFQTSNPYHIFHEQHRRRFKDINRKPVVVHRRQHACIIASLDAFTRGYCRLSGASCSQPPVRHESHSALDIYHQPPTILKSALRSQLLPLHIDIYLALGTFFLLHHVLVPKTVSRPYLQV